MLVDKLIDLIFKGETFAIANNHEAEKFLAHAVGRRLQKEFGKYMDVRWDHTSKWFHYVMSNYEDPLKVTSAIYLLLKTYSVPLDGDKIACHTIFHERYGDYVSQNGGKTSPWKIYVE